MARMGMDVDLVETAGKKLQTYAHQLETLVTQMNGVVSSLPGVWEGKDSNDFVQQWWPQHKKNLLAAKEAVNGLGQAALNNARDQRDVSGR